MSKNGFGLAIADVEREIRIFEKGMVLMPDSAPVYREWRRLVLEISIHGVKVHDARLVAAMQIHGVKHLLTLNPEDFVRYPQVVAVHPRLLAYID